MPYIAVQLAHLHHLDLAVRVADRFDRLAEGLDPVIDGNVADPQKPAYGAESQPSKLQLQSHRRAHPTFGHGVPIATAFAAVALPAIDDAVFDTALAVTFWTICHQNPIKNGERL
jgi:hypothetical protein